MTRLVLLGVVFSGALGWAVSAEAQTTVRYQQGKNGYAGVVDTQIDKFWDDTFGGIERLEVRHWDDTGSTEKMNLLIRFDVTNLPLDATVTSAKLTMFNLRARGQPASPVVVLQKVTSTWDNKTRWNTAPSVTATTVTCPPVDSLTNDPVVPEMYAITGLETLVQGWIASPATNFGIMLSCATSLNLKFASSEYPDPADTTIFSPYRPELEVTYTTPTPPPPPTVTVTSPPSTATTTPIAVSGTAGATSPATLTQVTWQNVTSGQSGTASGTTSWTANISLIHGNNLIRVTATDSLGGTASTSFTVSLPSTKKAGGSDNKLCGLGAAGGFPGSFGAAALGLALLGIAASRRKQRA